MESNLEKLFAWIVGNSQVVGLPIPGFPNQHMLDTNNTVQEIVKIWELNEDEVTDFINKEADRIDQAAQDLANNS